MEVLRGNSETASPAGSKAGSIHNDMEDKQGRITETSAPVVGKFPTTSHMMIQHQLFYSKVPNDHFYGSTWFQ